VLTSNRVEGEVEYNTGDFAEIQDSSQPVYLDGLEQRAVGCRKPAVQNA